MDALMLKNVSKAYENFQLKDISFTLPEGRYRNRFRCQ